MNISWARVHAGGYECSTAGDKRFSALVATMPDGRTIEMWYQCDIKGYDIGGRKWRLGKGKPPKLPYPGNQLWEMYLNLWRIWALHNLELMNELGEKAEKHRVLTDKFATTATSQARALATILNEWFS